MPRLMTQVIERIHSFASRTKASRSAILFLVIYTNMLDNLLLSSVVPIIPEILIDMDKRSLQNSIENDVHRNCNTSNRSSTIIVVDEDITEMNDTELGFAKRILQVSFSALDENSRVGWLLSSKALVQIFANPVVGHLCSRCGYSVILFFGTNILLLSSLIYTLCGSFTPLLVARCTQGLGSAACTIAGMSLLADRYPDDRDRSRVMGFAMGGTALGVVIGYPFGGFLYAYAGKLTPFALMFSFIIIDAALQYVILNPSISEKASVVGTPLHRLLRDPYILIASGTVMVTTMSISTLEPTVPIWIIDTMHAQKWQLGLVFLPDSIGYFVGTNFFGVITKTVGRWICSLSCMLLIGLCLTCIPFATSVTQLILPHFGVGLGLGITDAAIMPLLALLVDTRHVAAYGSVYSIVQLAVCLAYGIGPSLAGQIVKAVGFSWLIWGLAILNVGYSPCCWFLKNPPVKEENKPILDAKEDSTGTYTEY